MGSFSSTIFLMMPLAGSVLLALGIFQVIMDLRTAKQRKVIDRLSGSRASNKERQVKDTLLKKRAADYHRNVVEGVISRVHIVSKLQRILDQSNVDWSATRVLVNLIALGVGVGVLMFSYSSGRWPAWGRRWEFPFYPSCGWYTSANGGSKRSSSSCPTYSS